MRTPDEEEERLLLMPMGLILALGSFLWLHEMGYLRRAAGPALSCPAGASSAAARLWAP